MGIITKLEKKVVGDGNILERRIDYESRIVDGQYMTKKIFDSDRYYFNGKKINKLDGRAMWENTEKKDL